MIDAQSKLAKDRFIESFKAHGIVSRACRDAGVSRQAYYAYWLNDPDFVAARDDAVEEALDNLRDEAYRRAVEGVDEPVYQKGEHVGDIRRYSDPVLLKMMAARLPEYRALATSNQPKVDPEAEKKVVVEIVEVSDWDQLSKVKS